ncbi:MAG: RNA polymerase sigma factor [bacterium]|nr:RNA polymerase sigma factor [bacterium]
MNFEEMLEPVYQDAVRFARGLAGSKADGDDLLQDALMRAMRGFDRLRDRSRFRAWLFRILSNAHRNQVRKATLRRWLTLDQARQTAAPRELCYEEKEAVRQALQGVPRPQREALVLFEVVGLSIEEIAAVQDSSLSAAKSRLARGRIRLRQSYRKLEVNHGTR